MGVPPALGLSVATLGEGPTPRLLRDAPLPCPRIVLRSAAGDPTGPCGAAILVPEVPTADSSREGLPLGRLVLARWGTGRWRVSVSRMGPTCRGWLGTCVYIEPVKHFRSESRLRRETAGR
jgi:hypothetical protein